MRGARDGGGGGGRRKREGKKESRNPPCGERERRYVKEK